MRWPRLRSTAMGGAVTADLKRDDGDSTVLCGHKEGRLRRISFRVSATRFRRVNWGDEIPANFTVGGPYQSRTTAVLIFEFLRLRPIFSGMLNYEHQAEADAMVTKDEEHGKTWVVGRGGKSSRDQTTTAHVPSDSYVLTAKIKRDLEIELEAKVNKKVQKNMLRS